MSPLIMNDPIFRIMNGTDFRSTVYLIHVLAGSKGGGEGVYTKKEIFVAKKLNLKVKKTKKNNKNIVLMIQ